MQYEKSIVRREEKEVPFEKRTEPVSDHPSPISHSDPCKENVCERFFGKDDCLITSAETSQLTHVHVHDSSSPFSTSEQCEGNFSERYVGTNNKITIFDDRSTSQNEVQSMPLKKRKIM